MNTDTDSVEAVTKLENLDLNANSSSMIIIDKNSNLNSNDENNLANNRTYENTIILDTNSNQFIKIENVTHQFDEQYLNIRNSHTTPNQSWVNFKFQVKIQP